MKEVKKIKWLIAHEPVDLFLRTAEAFAEEVKSATDGAIELEIYTATEYAKKFNNGIKENPMVYMERGELELSQLHISNLWKWNVPALMALELPFLFKDHDHATRVLEGEIGRGMLNELKEKSPARGLEFTYSGGFRIVATDKEIQTLADFKNLSFYTGINPIGIDTVEAIGGVADAHPIEDYWSSIHTEGDNHDAVDSTVPRLLATVEKSRKRFITATEHSLFLTSIIVSEAWWSSLGEDLQSKISKAALNAARLERKWSIEDVERVASEGTEVGVEYKQLAQSEIDKFKELTAPLYDKYNSIFAPGLVDNIRKA
ncbi:DctP TRAP-type C4-dicarboxylate transport system, periplasmic component [uncultured Caudovirales phage]|uniref:DctP TRAP-type C4-dicarboxylate transport system, periplasmic component n=1 Tax=uncultured Caudovirales phage TaxID=2100421 RepID=A0A6J5L311_9CAUD|nr:DctP TRAP-type C4-dicarboxylate transport system, periplasmic component [uncultured Caudovirales phage]